MGSLWAVIKATRSGAYFMKALQSGGTKDLRQKWKEDDNWKNRVLLSGIIAAATIAISGRTLYRAAKKANKKRKQRKLERIKNKPVPQLEIYDDYNQFPELDRKTSSGKVIKANVSPKPAESNLSEYTPEHQEPQIINSYDTFAEDNKPKTKDEEIDTWFKGDMIPTGIQYTLSNNLINMSVDEINNKRPNSIKVKTSIGDWYINGSGIWTNEHETIFDENDKYKTLKMSKLLRKLKRSEYQDMFTIFETFIS